MKLAAGEKKLFAFCALVLLLPLGIGAFFNYINAPPVVPFVASPKTPTPNGYDLYVAAGTALVPATPPVDAILDDAPPLGVNARAKRYSLARKTAWLGANQKAFALFVRAQQTPALSRSLPPSGPKFPIKQLSGMARAKRVETYAHRMRGDWNGALQSGLDGVQMGHDIRRGAGVIHLILGARWGDYARLDVSDLPEQVSAIQAKSAARRLEGLLQTRWNLDQALGQEKVAAWGLLVQTFEDTSRSRQNWRPLLISYEGTPAPNLARLHLMSKQSVIDEIGVEFDRQIANARLPYAQKGVSLPPPSGLIFDDYANQGARWRFLNARDLAGDQLLMLQLALRAYHLKNGAYPRDLKALTPNYLSAIPADPFGGGEPMRYRPNGATYILWSIGPDQKDDGGTPVSWSKDDNPRAPRPEEPRRLPGLLLDSKGDFVAGKNRAQGFEWPRID